MKQLVYTDMQRVILASPINGAPYHGDLLPETPWQWPADTWLRKRLTVLTVQTVQNVQPAAPPLKTSDSDGASHSERFSDLNDLNGVTEGND